MTPRQRFAEAMQKLRSFHPDGLTTQVRQAAHVDDTCQEGTLPPDNPVSDHPTMSELRKMAQAEVAYLNTTNLNTAGVRCLKAISAAIDALAVRLDWEALRADDMTTAFLTETKAREKAEREVERLTKERFGLTVVITELLTSADCTWEERKEGHDWHEACEAARAALRRGDR